MQVQLVNQSKIVEADFDNLITALQSQLVNDFYQKGHSVSRDLGDGILYVMDTDADAPPDAAGWHTTDDQGRPYGIIPIAILGDDYSATISHELLEMIADPYCGASIYSYWNNRRASLSYEVCDPVENDEYPVTINDVTIMLSNFVLPAWWHKGTKGPFDFMRKLQAPLTMTPGGYVQYHQGGSWHQDFSPDAKAIRRNPSNHCRRRRRERAA